MFKEKYFTCSCGCCHALRIGYDSEDNLTEFAIFERTPVYYSFWNRIRIVWHVLKTGRDWGDHVILCAKDVKKLATYLSKIKEKGVEEIEEVKLSRTIVAEEE